MAKDILIYGDIEQFLAQRFIESIDEIDDGELSVRINTNGGNPEIGWGIIAKIIEFDGNTKVKVDGKAYSMGLFIACYIDEVEALDVSQFILHRAAWPSWFEESSFFTDALKSNLEAINKNLMEAFKRKVDVPKFEKIAGVKLKDVFSMDSRIDVPLTAQEAKQIGLINKINKITPKKSAELKTLIETFDVKLAAKVDDKPADSPQNKNEMDFNTLKADHPKLYAQVIAMGVTDEKDRVGAWMEFIDIDPESVKAGISSGENISQTDMAKFNKLAAEAKVEKKDDEGSEGSEGSNAKAASELEAEGEKTNNVDTVVDDVDKTASNSGPTELEALEAKMDAHFGLNKESKK